MSSERLSSYLGLNIGWLLDTQAAARSGHEYLIWEPRQSERRTYTYAEWASLTKRMASVLRSRGVRAGDRVLIHMDNCPEMLLGWFACGRIGAVAVTTNTRSATAELSYYAEHAGITGVLTSTRYLAQIREACASAKWLLCAQDEDGGGNGDLPDSIISLRAAMAGAIEDTVPEPVGSNSPLFVQYTSGTTARPKGVVWTHANALWGAEVAARHESLQADDTHLVTLPLFHVNALVYSMLATMWAGGRAVLTPSFSASRFWELSLRHRCTWASMIPFSVKAMLAHEVPDHYYRLWGFARCDPAIDSHFGVKTIGWWGMTETISHGVIGDALHDNEPLSIGRPAVEYSLAIEHPDGGRNRIDEPGELLIRGTRGLSLFDGYLNDPVATEQAFDADGWFRTGDLVRVSEQGYVFFLDRAKDMLKVGGENVAASEIEALVLAVAGVSEVAAVAKLDPALDEVPVLFVVSTKPQDETEEDALCARIAQTCRENLAEFKVPRAIYVVADLPRSTLEKVAKAELREMLEKDEIKGYVV